MKLSWDLAPGLLDMDEAGDRPRSILYNDIDSNKSTIVAERREERKTGTPDN